MIIEKFTDTYFGENTYLVADKNTREGAVIDPGGDIKDLMRYIEDNSIEVKYILLTHGHGDHIGCVPELKEATNAQIIAHKDEQEILLDKKKNLSYSMRCGATEFEADRYVEEKESVKIGDLKLTFLHTPGHTRGGVCFYSAPDKFIVTGDSLFQGSIGRTDLPGGDYDALMESLLTKVCKVDVDSKVYPGHGPETTIAHELNTNPFLRYE